MRFKELRAVNKSHESQEKEKFQYFHLSPIAGLTELKPRLARHFSKRENAAFVTTKDRLSFWAHHIADRGNTEMLYLYGVKIPEGTNLTEGIDGAEMGDYKIVGEEPLELVFLRTVYPRGWSRE